MANLLKMADAQSIITLHARGIETGSQLEFKISRVAAASSAVPVATSELSVIVQKTASVGGETGTESIDDPQFKAFPRRADNR